MASILLRMILVCRYAPMRPPRNWGCNFECVRATGNSYTCLELPVVDLVFVVVRSIYIDLYERYFGEIRFQSNYVVGKNVAAASFIAVLLMKDASLCGFVDAFEQRTLGIVDINVHVATLLHAVKMLAVNPANYFCTFLVLFQLCFPKLKKSQLLRYENFCCSTGRCRGDKNADPNGEHFDFRESLMHVRLCIHFS